MMFYLILSVSSCSSYWIVSYRCGWDLHTDWGLTALSAQWRYIEPFLADAWIRCLSALLQLLFHSNCRYKQLWMSGTAELCPMTGGGGDNW